MAKFTGHTITSDSALGSAKLERSLRFNRTDSAYITRTVGTTGNRRTWTVSFWMKFCEPTAINNQRIWSNESGDGNGDILKIELYGGTDQARQIGFIDNNHAGSGIRFTTDRGFRDNSWYHIMMAVDTTQATDTNRVKIYVNGDQLSNWLSGSEHNHPPNQNYDTCVNLSGEVNSWGRSFSFGSSTANYFDGYLTEINFIDGQQLSPTDLGFTDPVTGIWMPKKYEGTYGTNGYRLDFSDNTSTTTLGIDKSPNGNDFTLNNFSVAAGKNNDSLEDIPTNNFCTMNPLMMNGTEVAGTHSDGLLTWKSDNNYATTQATFPVTTGKWYWECEMESQYVSIAGITRGTNAAENTFIGYDTNGNLFGFGYYYNDGTVKGTTDGLGTTSNNNLATSQTTAANGDILGIASDIANGYLIFYKNGTHIYTITGISNAFDWFPSFSSYGTSATWHVNYGQRPFSYTPPVGHKSLCSENLLPDSSIVKPQRNFETLLYTGNDGSQTITGLEFDPDFVWAKNRQDNGYHHDLYDTVRGNNLRIFSSQNQAEATGYLQFGVTGGFSLTSGGGINSNSKNHVAWCWKAGGAAVTNTVGNLPAQVSVNEEAGFSIVSYTGNGSNGQTVGHGLGKKPAWIILKNRDASQNWRVWHKELASDGSKRLLLDAMNASEDAGFLNDTAPTSTVFTLGKADDAWNANGNKFIAYCWAEIPGYSKFGSYKGNGSTNGTYVHLGFKPAFIITKQTNGTGSWFMFDNKRNGYNETEPYVMSNVSNTEATDLGWDFLSHGFKHRNNYAATNGSGNTFIYMAFAEQPGITSFDTFPNAR